MAARRPPGDRAGQFEPLPAEAAERWAGYGAWDEVYFPRLVGLVVEELRSDYCRMRLPWRTEITQPAGVAHGGAIAALVDSVVVPAIGSALRRAPRLRHDRPPPAVPRRARRRGRRGRGVGHPARAGHRVLRGRGRGRHVRPHDRPRGRWPTRSRAACRIRGARVAVLRVPAGASLRCPPVPATRTLSEAASKELLRRTACPSPGERIVADADGGRRGGDRARLPGRRQAVRRRDRPQDRAGARAARPRHAARRCERAGADLLAAATPGRRRGRAAGGADGAGQPRSSSPGSTATRSSA